MTDKIGKRPSLDQTRGSSTGPAFDPKEFVDELAVAGDNHQVGTRLCFENERVQVWELALQPGERAPFHCHTRDYFWTCVDAGRGLQRFDDGTSRIVDISVGDTNFLYYTDNERTIHDLENVGDTPLRTVTVVLKKEDPPVSELDS